MIRSILFLVLGLLILQSCVTIKPDAPMVHQTDSVQFSSSSQSFLNIPIQLLLGEIEILINKEIPTNLYTDNNIDIGHGVTLKLNVQRNGAIKLVTEKGTVKSTVPLIINGELAWVSKLCDFCPSISQNKTFQLKIQLISTSTIQVNSNWSILSKTTSDFTFDDPPCIKVAGIPVCFENTARDKIKENLPKINSEIDKAIASSFDLKKTAVDLYHTFAQPYLVSNSPVNTWTIFKADGFGISAPQSKDAKTLVYNLNVRGIISFIIGAKPAVVNIPPLPAITLSNSTRNDFELKIPVSVYFTELQTYCNSEIIGKTFQIPNSKRKVLVKNIGFYGVDSTLVIWVDFKSKFTKGLLYFESYPVYNTSTKQINLTNVKINSKTNNVLLNKAAWLSSTLFNKQLENKMVFDLSKNIDDNVAKIKTSLANYQVNEHVLMKMNIKDVNISAIKVKSNRVEINALTKGDIEMKIK